MLDERYSYLDVRDDVVVLGDHEHDGLIHPMIWAREHGAGRVVYDGLGHDLRSYESAGAPGPAAPRGGLADRRACLTR